MKVLHVIPAVAPRYGGPSQAVFAMGRALAACGVVVHIATTDADGDAHLSVRLEQLAPFDGVPTIFFHRQWGESLKYSAPLARWLAANVAAYDVVHIHAAFSHASVAAARACRDRGVPYIVRPLGTLTPWSLGQKPMRKHVAWRLRIGRLLREAAAIQYTTLQEQRSTEASLGLGRGHVVGLGVDAGLIDDATVTRSLGAPLFKQYEPYVLALCRLHPVKALEPLLEALLEVMGRPRFEPWRVLIAGDGDPAYVARLKRVVSADVQQDRVVFTGWLEGPAKVEALRGASLYALPSRHESFGLSVVEALACGVPVLVSPHVSVADEIRSASAGWIVDIEHQSLVEALVEALADEQERARRGAAGRNLVRARFTWPVVATQLVDLYRTVVDDAVLCANGPSRPRGSVGLA